MSKILFLDFQKNLESPRVGSSSVFNQSIRMQYESIKSRIPSTSWKSESLEKFIEICFPTALPNSYSFICPNLVREKVIKDDASFLNNVVIWPHLNDDMKLYLPRDTNIILVGSIKETQQYKQFVVQGLELIDINIASSSNFFTVNDAICCSTFQIATNRNGNSFPQWTMDRPDHNATLFTADFVSTLIEKSFPVDLSHLPSIYSTFEQWQEYLNFRIAFLKQLSNRFYAISRIELLTGYSINKHSYRMNSTLYEESLLINHKEFNKGELFILSSPIKDADELKLIRVDIDFPYKEYEAAEVEVRGKIRNTLHSAIVTFSRDNLALSTVAPSNSQQDNYLRNSFSLDDKYKLIDEDILPDCSDIVSRYVQLIKEEIDKIEERYEARIAQAVQQAINQKRESFKVFFNEELKQFDLSFNQNLPQIIKENSDPIIKNEVNLKIKSMKSILEKETEKELSKLNPRNDLYISKKAQLEEEEQERLKQYIETINYPELYRKKHQLNKETYSKKLQDNHELGIKSLERSLRNDLIVQNQLLKKAEIIDKQLTLQKQQEDEISDRVKNNKIKRYTIFFKIDRENIPSQVTSYKYLVYDNRAEQSKLNRQQNALKNLKEGYVKNPFLLTYLFTPSDLEPVYYDYSNWNWFLPSLNALQKEAVQKAVASNGIYLIQGPPGTGKTQVIAEIVGHLVQDNKKVLIASETHKAIDNVFDRLPDLADIRPLRLIADKSGKDSEYGPGSLVDNFYANIANSMKRVIRKFEDFTKYKEDFQNSVQRNSALNLRILRGKSKIVEVEKQIKRLNSTTENLKISKSNLQDKIDDVLIDIDVLKRTSRHLQNSNLKLDDDIDQRKVLEFIKQASPIIRVLPTGDVLDQTTIETLLKMSESEIKQEFESISLLGDEFKQQQDRDRLKYEISLLRDEVGETIRGQEQKIKLLIQQYKDLMNNQQHSANLSAFHLTKLFALNEFDNYERLLSQIIDVRDRLIELRIVFFEMIDKEISKKVSREEDLRTDIAKIDHEIANNSDLIRQVQDDDEFQEIRNNEARLRKEISKFIETFGITFEYTSFDDAIGIMNKQFNQLEIDYQHNELESQKTLPILKKISAYLSNKDVIEADRVYYTKPLFERANLFGITTSSRQKFDEKSISNMSQYNLGNLDLSSVGIDTVIIDEVSKSSFIELLNPILFGKTIILVGDHRQLPPMYEFANLRNEDFEHISEDVLTYEKNQRFTQLYQRSFFKELFENVPLTFKTMLNQQYRSHEHIMNVYNCFYNGKLQVGKVGQNNEKLHHLSIITNNRQIIVPQKHVYFINCKKFEAKNADSTSIYNPNEIDVVLKLLQLIDASYKQQNIYNSEQRGDYDERMSIGVICTYRDQARLIRARIRDSRIDFTMFNQQPESKLIVSTVDDFQGDERDIIILSMVRNPEVPARSQPGFITAYQRVNVALSRARRLLIVVGNRKYLEEKGIIDLPDVFGNPRAERKDFHMYKDIIGNIAKYGNIIDDIDVLGGY